MQSAYTGGKRLVLALVPLDSYRVTDLPASFLTTLGARFASVRAAGMKTTLLFSYDFGGGLASEGTKAFRELQIETVNNNEITNFQTLQHTNQPKNLAPQLRGALLQCSFCRSMAK